MGAVRMRVQTADKNITIIHTTPVQQWTLFTRLRWRITTVISTVNPLKMFFLYFDLKKYFYNTILCIIYKVRKKSIIHINTSSSEKVVWSESGEKSAQIKHCLQAKIVQNSSEQTCGWILMWETTGDGLFHLRTRYYGSWTRKLQPLTFRHQVFMQHRRYWKNIPLSKKWPIHTFHFSFQQK